MYKIEFLALKACTETGCLFSLLLYHVNDISNMPSEFSPAFLSVLNSSLKRMSFAIRSVPIFPMDSALASDYQSLRSFSLFSVNFTRTADISEVVCIFLWSSDVVDEVVGFLVRVDVVMVSMRRVRC